MIAHHKIRVLDAKMAYLDVGDGRPIVFLHGNPTSSYLWRNIIPHLAGIGRCLAPDLIGMGASDKIEGSEYRFVDHRRYLDGWFEAMGLSSDIVLVVHDWGSALGFDWARRHPDAVAGVAFMEAITSPASTATARDGEKGFYNFMRSAEGEKMVLENNFFMDEIMFKGMGDHLTQDDRDAYRKPFLDPGEARRPTITWPREIPVDGEPADTQRIISDYQVWMETNDLPKLFVNVQPGVIMWEGGERLAAARRWSNQTEIVLQGDPDPPGPSANHYVQEVTPDEIGGALARWIGEL